MINLKNFLNKKIFFGKPLWELMIAIAIFIIPITYAFGGKKNEVEKLKQNSAFTLGLTDRISYGGQSSRYIHYQFKVDSLLYQGTKSTWNKTIMVPKGKVLVLYNKENPKLNTGFFDEDLSEYDSLGVKLDQVFYGKVKEVNLWNYN